MVLEILLSYTVVLGVAFLAGVLVAAYAGTTLALRRFFDETDRTRSPEG